MVSDSLAKAEDKAISRGPSIQLKTVRSEFRHGHDQPESLECLVTAFRTYEHCLTTLLPGEGGLGDSSTLCMRIFLLMLTPTFCNYLNPPFFYRASVSFLTPA